MGERGEEGVYEFLARSHTDYVHTRYIHARTGVSDNTRTDTLNFTHAHASLEISLIITL